MQTNDFSFNDEQNFSEINVVPLVDIILVLLIIFMIAAPMMKAGIEVDLPEASPRQFNVDIEERYVISISAQGDVYLNQSKIPIDELEQKIRQLYHNKPDKGVFLQADKRVPYGIVVKVMDHLKRAGIENLGVITESPER